jgi:hypothetical protein
VGLKVNKYSDRTLNKEIERGKTLNKTARRRRRRPTKDW